MRPLTSSLLVLALTACTAPADDDTDDTDDTDAETDDTDGDTTAYDPMDIPPEAVDIRRDFPAPTWEGGIVLESEPFWVPPYSEKQICFFTSWTEETMGIHAQRSYQNDYGHHFIVASSGLTQRDIPDGSVVDCTESGSVGMESFRPLMVGGDIDVETQSGFFELPEGMAARVNNGQRVVLQAHYVNTSAEPILVQDALQLDVMTVDEVETWAAPWINTEGDFQIPAASEHTEVVNCTATENYTLLFLGGHLHEWGTAISVDRTRGETTERIYEVATWDPLFRDAPPYAAFEAGSMTVEVGDVFTTTCSWNNDTPAPMEFPQEMCVSLGMVYPATTPIICDPD